MTDLDIIDIHTHRPGPQSILNVEPGDAVPAQPFSVGIHPWHLHEATPELWERLEFMASQPGCMAIGETGFDPNATASASVQAEAFERHVALSERLGKPVIVHCVRSLDALIAARRRLQPKQPWIWHGFRGSPEMAEQLRRHGILYSLGPRFNPATAAATPLTEILLETDDDPSVTIADVASRVAQARGMSLQEVLDNAKTFVNL